MKNNKHFLAIKLAELSTRHPWLMLMTAIVITIISIGLSSGLEMRMNWSDTLPKDDPIVKSYREVQNRFGDPFGIVVALEGDYDRICAMADSLEPRLKEMEGLYSVQGRLPLDYFREHGFLLMKPNDFDRMLRVFSNPSLIGTFRGFNDDYEREYTDSESNMKRDEVNIARSLLGTHRALEILTTNLALKTETDTSSKSRNPVKIENAVDAFTLGESWIMSLDRRMLLIACQPVASQLNFDQLIAEVEKVELIVNEISHKFPDVSADLTGMAKIGQDEMNSIGIYTIFLSLGALLLIYILLARSFRGWVLPIIALTPLIIGIFWTMGLLYILFGSLNIFTAMMGIVLLGLGIDFSIHTISRFNEEITLGKGIKDALIAMLNGTGVAVLTGGLTTAAAFLTLLIGETAGVFEFGAAAGFGVLLTLLAVFFVLPPLLVVRKQIENVILLLLFPLHWIVGRIIRLFSKRPGNNTVPTERNTTLSEQMPIIGKIAQSSYRHPFIFLSITILVVIFSIWAKQNIGFEYDFLNLEPKGLESVQLQREIPERFGMSDHAAWVIANSIEESRELKEKFKKKSLVGDVVAISDYIPPAERVEQYKPRLLEFRKTITPQSPNQSINIADLLIEINRLWDNLDLMSNLAYTAGLDRIVKVIDGITGTESETGKVDKSAVLPTLTMLLEEGIDHENAFQVAVEWETRMRANLYAMSNPEPVGLGDLPEVIKRSHLPREGDGFLVHVVPRKYLFSKEELDRFAEQTSSVSQDVAGTEQLIVVMFDSILSDGKKAALLALLVIIVLVLVHFHGPIGLLSLVPLAAGALSMIGLMFIIGEKYNYMNLMAVPVILGIGIDDGIHALHRFRNEKGSGIDRVYNSFSFVGRTILLTSLTTMIGFGSIAFYTMEGMASFGRALFMGVGACFLATVLVLPAVLRLFTKSNS
ncbi:MAG: MMPL family transporter [Candidatus Hatepunaea meridiana]|nr:MMPL family transporter [Candidatus Hatepunaea meridiana]